MVGCIQCGLLMVLIQMWSTNNHFIMSLVLKSDERERTQTVSAELGAIGARDFHCRLVGGNEEEKSDESEVESGEVRLEGASTV